MRNTRDRVGGMLCGCPAGTRGKKGGAPGVGLVLPASGWGWRAFSGALASLTGLDSYTRDGTAISSNSPDGSTSTGHGAWERLPEVEENDFAETVLFSVLDPFAFPPGTEFVKVRGEMKVVSRDEMTGIFIVEFLDAGFTVLFSGTGTRLHTRIGVEPMP